MGIHSHLSPHRNYSISIRHGLSLGNLFCLKFGTLTIGPQRIKYSSVPHGALPENKEVVDTNNNGDMFLVNHRGVLGSPGHDWYLQLGFKYIEGQDSRTTLLMGLSAFMEIVPAFINGFELLPLSDISTLPALISNDPDPNKGFPKTAVLAFKYFLVKNKTNVCGVSSQSPSTQTPQNMRHNDEEEFKPPTMLWGVVRV
jgi:hypothetical protein